MSREFDQKSKRTSCTSSDLTRNAMVQHVFSITRCRKTFVIGHDHSTSTKRVMHSSGKKINRWPWQLWNKIKESGRTYDNKRNNTMT